MVRRLPAGPAICSMQGNACFPIVFKGSGAAVTGSSGLLGRRPGDAFKKTRVSQRFRSAPPCVSQLPKDNSMCSMQSVLALRRSTDITPCDADTDNQESATGPALNAPAKSVRTGFAPLIPIMSPKEILTVSISRDWGGERGSDGKAQAFCIAPPSHFPRTTTSNSNEGGGDSPPPCCYKNMFDLFYLIN